jgi:hypothetical protein
MNVIAYDRDHWEAMLIYRQGYKTLSMNVDTLDIALNDMDRYQSILKSYVA